MHRDSACAEFQMQYTFILDSAKINSCSYFVKVLKKQKFQQDFMELQPQHQLSRVPEPGRKTPVTHLSLSQFLHHPQPSFKEEQ